MEYRYMGKTGLQLSVLSFGSWITFHKQFDDSVADELMGIAYDNGINFFDNAEIYALGESEKMMGRILKKKNWDRTSYVISSKAYFGSRPKGGLPNQNGLSRKHLVEACHEALQRFQTDYLDLYFCHRPDKKTPMDEIVWTMNQLINQGKILYWGTSEWSAQEIMEAHAIAKDYRLIGPAMEQPEYNIFNRQKMECDFLQIFKNMGLGTTIWSPLASGLLTGKYNNGIPEGSRLALAGFEWLRDKTHTENKLQTVKALQNIAEGIGMSLANMSLAWCIKNTNVTTAIIGATSSNQLYENLKALDCVPMLTQDVMESIDLAVNNKPIQPPY
jgi:voltage-dependent potassium channel beta subunit